MTLKEMSLFLKHTYSLQKIDKPCCLAQHNQKQQKH